MIPMKHPSLICRAAKLALIFLPFCLSPLILFAQEVPPIPTEWDTEEDGVQTTDIISGQASAATNQGSLIAVVKITVKDKDAVDTIAEERTELPDQLSLYSNYPNPFNTSTSIVFDLPEPARVYTEVFDTLGRLVHTSQARRLDAGWNHTLSLHLPITSSGVYIYRLVADTVSDTLVRTGRILQVR